MPKAGAWPQGLRGLFPQQPASRPCPPVLIGFCTPAKEHLSDPSSRPRLTLSHWLAFFSQAPVLSMVILGMERAAALTWWAGFCACTLLEASQPPLNSRRLCCWETFNVCCRASSPWDSALLPRCQASLTFELSPWPGTQHSEKCCLHNLQRGRTRKG